MNIQYLHGNEKNRIRHLYEKVFQDSKAFTDYYFAKEVPKNKVLAAVEDNAVVSMLQLAKKQVMIHNVEKTVHYVYGVATDVEYRHKGLMAALMKQAILDLEKKGEPFLYLVPVQPEVYRKFGFHTVYEKKCYRIPREEEIEKITAPGEKDMVVLRSICDRILPAKYDTYLVHDRAYFLRALFQIKLDGGYVVYHRKGNSFQGYSLVDGKNQVMETVCEGIPDVLEYTGSRPWIMVRELSEKCSLGNVCINDET